MIPLRSYLAQVIFIVGVSLFAGCDDSDPSAPQVERIEVAVSGGPSNYIALTRGLDLQLVVTAFNAAGQRVDGARPAFTSRVPTIVSVTEAGMMRSLEPGRTWIVAGLRAGSVELRDSIEVLVTSAP